MGVKKSNELTLRIKGDIESFIKNLENNGFEKGETFTLDDYYYIPSNLNIDNLSTREIIAKAIIVRNVTDISPVYEEKHKMTFKKKVFGPSGEILSQEAAYMSIKDDKEAFKFLEALDYKLLVHIFEDDVVYKKDNFEFAIKNIKNGDKLIEVETEEGNETCDTIEKIEKSLKKYNVQVDFSDLYVKKVEIETNKVLGRN